MLINYDNGDFRFKSEAPGSITMNTFKYQLKRKPSRRSTSIEQLGAIPDRLSDQIASNLFLRDSIEDYPHLKSISNRFRGLNK